MKNLFLSPKFHSLLKPKQIKLNELSKDEQIELINPLVDILRESGIIFDSQTMTLKCKRTTKNILVYPAMWSKQNDNKIFVNDIYLRFAKPYALNIIKNSF